MAKEAAHIHLELPERLINHKAAEEAAFHDPAAVAAGGGIKPALNGPKEGGAIEGDARGPAPMLGQAGSASGGELGKPAVERIL